LDVVNSDPYGNKLYHRQQYLITADKIVPVSALGDRQYSKSQLIIKQR
jgi:hypothetical protein